MSFWTDVKADEELITAKMKGIEMKVVGPVSTLYRKLVAAVAGFRSGWKSITQAAVSK